MPKTRSEINADTIVFFPHIIDFPKVTPEFFLRQAALDIITLLTNPPPFTVPSLNAGNKTKNAILQLATILGTNPLSQQSWSDQHHATIKQAAQLPTIITAPPKANNTTSSTPIQTLQNTLTRLARVLKTTNPTQKTIHPSTANSFKHRAATFLVENHQHQSPIQNKSFHIYTAQGEQLTLETALHSTSPLSPKAFHIFDDNGKKLTLDKVLKGPMQDIWNKSTSNEFGRLAQGNKFGVKFRDVMEFITKKDLPATCNVTYASFVLDYRPLKSEPWRVRLVVGGDKLPYPHDAGSPATNLLETKILLNSVISDAKRGARFMSLDLKDFFLMSPMPVPEFMKIHIKNFPPDII